MTKENTKFKDILENIFISIPNHFKTFSERTIRITEDEFKEIRLALRLADRLTMEPSEGMICQASKQSYSPYSVSIFKAMIDQLFKELDEETK